jgi:predicted RecB family nuclease
MVKGRHDGVLDTDRPVLEQISVYNEFDVRYES